MLTVQAILILATFITFFICMRMKYPFKISAFIILCLTNMNALVGLRMRLEDLPPLQVYFYTFMVGIGQQFTTMLFLHFKFRLVSSMLILGQHLSFFFSLNLAVESINFIEVSLSIMMSVVLVCATLLKELNERTVFQKFFMFNRDDTKRLLEKHLPQGVLVVDQTLQEVLFMNESFQKTFLLDAPTTTVQRLLETLTIHNSDSSPKNELIEVLKGDSAESLASFLTRTSQLDKLNTSGFTIYAVMPVPAKEDLLFEVKVFKPEWGYKEPIGMTFTNITQQRDILVQGVGSTIRSKLLSTLSHELKTPLHGILTMSDLSLKRTRDSEALFALDFCRKNAALLLSFISSLLDYQMILADKLELKPTKANLEILIGEVISLFELHRSQKGINLIYGLDNNLPLHITTDTDRLSQVLIILINNAIKFTQTGDIIIHVKPDPLFPKKILFEVEDTGVGISPAQQKNLFKVLEGLGPDESCTYGVGFGLSIANELIKSLSQDTQGEAIKCVSEANKGSVFSFSVLDQYKDGLRLLGEHSLSVVINHIEDYDVNTPKNQSSQSPGGISKSHEMSGSISSSILAPYDFEEHCLLAGNTLRGHLSSGSQLLLIPNSTANNFNNLQNLRRKKEGRAISIKVTPPRETNQAKAEVMSISNRWILLVDDSPLNILVAKKLIEDLGYQVKTAEHGQDAIEKVRSHVESGEEFFKLILMDCQMPVMDGYNATIALKEMMKANKIPSCMVIAFTANDGPDDIKKCRDCGMDDVLPKPLGDQGLWRLKSYLKE